MGRALVGVAPFLEQMGGAVAWFLCVVLCGSQMAAFAVDLGVGVLEMLVD